MEDNHAEAKMAVAEYEKEMDPSKEGDGAVLKQLKEKEKETYDKTDKERKYTKKTEDNHAEAKMAVAEYEKKMDPSKEGDVAVLERLKEKEKETYDKTNKAQKRNANTIGGRSVHSRMVEAINECKAELYFPQPTDKPSAQVVRMRDALVSGLKGKLSIKELADSIKLEMY